MLSNPKLRHLRVMLHDIRILEIKSFLYLMIDFYVEYKYLQLERIFTQSLKNLIRKVALNRQSWLFIIFNLWEPGI